MFRTLQKNMSKYRLELFVLLVSIQFILAAVASLFLPVFANNVSLISMFRSRFSIGVVVVCAIFALFSAALFIWIRSSPKTREYLAEFFSNSGAQFIPIILPVLLTGFLASSIVSQDDIIRSSALLICIWAICMEFILLFAKVRETKQQFEPSPDHKQKLWAIAGCLLTYAVLFIPSKLHSSLDGLPLDNQQEFIIALLILPLMLVVNWSFFSKKHVLIIIVIILALRLVVSSTLPESGLNVWLYQSAQKLADNKWENSYSSVLNPTVSQIMKAPYENTRQFPFALLDDKVLDKNSNKFPWVGIKLQGSVKLEKGEKLVFLVRGLQKGEAFIKNIKDGQIIQLPIIDSSTPVKNKIVDEIQTLSDFQINGTFVFQNTYQYNLIPILVRQDGTQIDLFHTNKVWASDDIGSLSPFILTFANLFLFCANSLFFGLIALGLYLGLVKLFKENRITSSGLFIITSSSALFLMPNILGTTFNVTNTWNVLSLESITLMLPITSFIVIATLLTILEHKFSKSLFENPENKFIFSVGIILLMTFLVINIPTLRETNIFLVHNDPFEYQDFARNIFVNNDFLLFRTPPRAYKFLFPYIVGALHIIFGQSSAAQMYINTWCCVLNSIIMIKILGKSEVRPIFAYGAGCIFSIITFGAFSYNYFQFGMIEPLATLFLLLVFLFAQMRQPIWLIIAGAITTSLRMDYAGPAFAAILLYDIPFVGTVKIIWKQVFKWVRDNWMRAVLYAFMILLPVLLVTGFYFHFIKNYWLNARDTQHTSIYSIFDGWRRLAMGGNLGEIYRRFSLIPVIAILTTFFLSFGTSIGILATIFRPGPIKNLDMRWSIIIVSLFSVYIFIRPTVYAPRYSTHLLPITIIILFLLLEYLARAISSKLARKSQGFS